jgi:ABC-type Fe3+ transport system permease subunit
MSHFEIRRGVRQRGLGQPPWRRAIGLFIIIAGVVCVIAAMVSLGIGQ